MFRRHRPAHLAKRTTRFRIFGSGLGLALIAAGLLPAVINVQPAAAAGAFTLAESVDSGSVLYGTPSTVSLTATGGGTVEYNLSLTDVLPAGVHYVSGSTTPATIGNPTIISNEPLINESTLIWANVADLQPASSLTLGFKVLGNLDTDAGPPAVVDLPGTTYHDTPSAYVNSDPRTVPVFSSTGTPSNFTDSESATGQSVTITPFKTTLTDDLPESELERGVHDQKAIWTLTVTNNSVHPTALTEIDAWLPAGLEFLDCGAVDNTTNAPTNTGSALEYIGAPALTAGTTLPTTGSAVNNVASAPCAVPTDVSTENSITPPQLTGSSNEANPVYTEAQWVFGAGTGDLTPTTLGVGDTYTIRYLAAVPLDENTMTWSGATPSTTGSGQASNLDNNSGADTLSLSTGTGSDQTSSALATGNYSGACVSGCAPASSSGTDTVTIHDIAIQKSVDDAAFVEGNDVEFTLDYETSEYRYSTATVITDTLPDGLCPIDGVVNEAGTETTTDANYTECNPVPADAPSVAYSSVTELSTPSASVGEFTIVWNLGTLTTDLDGTITYFARDRAFYQEFDGTDFGPAAPTLTADGFSNAVVVGSTTHATCENAGVIDPECISGAGTVAIFPAHEPTASTAAESNPSAAGQSATVPTINKLVGSPTTGTCTSGVTYSSVVPNFQLGDLACFQLTVTFPSGLYTRDPLVQDFLPPNSTYDAAASGKDPVVNDVTIPTVVPNNVPATANGDGGAANPAIHAANADGQLVSFYLGDTLSGAPANETYAAPGQTFQYDLGAIVEGSPSAGNTFDLTSNLMKFTSFNTPSAATANRTNQNYDITTPLLSLVKGVESVNGTNVTNGGNFDGNVDGVRVDDGDLAKFRIDVKNEGGVATTTTTIWDVLGADQDCTEISTISNSGVCDPSGTTNVPDGAGGTTTVTSPTIVWTGSNIGTIPANSSSTTLTFVLVVPATAANGDDFANTAGIASYKSTTNTGGVGTVTYVPQTGNIVSTDGGTPTAPSGTTTIASATPAGAIKDPSDVLIAKPTLSKGLVLSSPSSQTIGGDAQYKIVATQSAGGTLYDGVTNDPLGTSLTYDASGPDGAATTSCAGGAITGTDVPVLNGGTDGQGFSFTEAANTLTLDWPTTLAESSSNAVCTIVFDATLSDVATSKAGGSAVPNTASFAYDNENAQAQTPLTSTQNITVIEPHVGVTKTDSDAGNAVPHQALPGETVTYTLGLSNTGTSPSHDMVVTDCMQGGVNYVSGQSTIHLVAPANSLAAGSAEPVVTHPGAGACSSAGDTLLTWTLDSASLFNADTVLNNGSTGTITYQGVIPATPVGTNSYLNNAAITVTSLDTTIAPGARTSTTATGFGLPGYSATANDTLTVPGTAISKSASPSTLTVGEDSTFTVTVTIPANISFPDLEAIDLLPNGMTFDSYVSATCAEQTLPVTACVDGVASPIDTLTPTPSSTGTGANAGKTALGWWIGNVTADANVRIVTLTYKAYPSETYVNATPHANVSSGDTLTNTVSTYWNDTTGTNPGTAPDPATGSPFGFNHTLGNSTSIVTVTAPALSIAKSHTLASPAVGQTGPIPGETLHYSVTVSNATVGAPAFLTTVTDAIPNLLEVTSGTESNSGVLSGTNGDGSGGTITWTLTGDEVDQGTPLVLTYDATIAPSADFTTATETLAITNTATLHGYYDVTNGTATGNTARYVEYTPTTPNATDSATPIFPQIAVSKYTGSSGTSTTGMTDIGDATSWHMVLTNTTDAPLQSIVVVDTLPTGWSYNTGTTSILEQDGTTTFTSDPTITGGGLTLAWNVPGGLGIGNHITVTYQATPSSTAVLHTVNGNVNSVNVSGSDTSAAHATGVGTGGTFAAYTASSTASDTIPQADLEIAKTDSGGGTFSSGTNNTTGGTFDSGGTGTYTLTVTNKSTPLNGDVANEPIAVTDAIPTGETFTSATGTGWSCNSAPASTVTCTFGSAGSSLGVGLSLAPISLHVNVTSTTVTTPGNTIVNSASVTDTGTFDPNTANNTSIDTVTIAGADLIIAKTNASPFVPGQHNTYSLVVSNNTSGVISVGTVANPISVTDTLPTGETYVSASGSGWTCNSAPAATMTCTYPTNIVHGTPAPTISLVVAIASAQTASITNTGVVSSGATGDIDTTNNTSSDVTTMSPIADLTTTKVLVGTTLTAGSNAVYTIVVKNLVGPSDAAAPQVVDVLPTGETFVSATGTNWTCVNVTGTVTCSYATTLVATASSTPITLTALVASGLLHPEAIINTENVTTTTTESDYTNNSASASGTAGIVMADLQLTKSHTGTFISGGTGTYTLAVKNLGPSDSIGTVGSPITVTDTLPQGETYSSAAGTGWTFTHSGQTVGASFVGTIVDGTTASPITIVVTISSATSDLGTLNAAQNGWTLINTAVVAAGATTDPVSSNNTASDPTIINGADLSITKSHVGAFVAGAQGAYQLTVNNLGLADSVASTTAPIVVTDTLPTGETFVGANGSGWTCTNAAQVVTCSESTTISASTSAPAITVIVGVDPAATGTLVNTAIVTPGITADPNTANNTASDPATLVYSSDLSIVKSHTGDFVLDSNGSYNLAVTNIGPSANPGPVVVTDPLPNGETFVSAVGSGWSCTNAAGTVTCLLPGSLGLNAAAPAITLTVDVGVDAYPTVTNTASVASSPGDPATDPTSTNNNSSDPVTPTPVAALRLTKRLQGTLKSSMPATYVIKVINDGPSPATDVSVKDNLPAGLTAVKGTGDGWDCKVSDANTLIECERPTLVAKVLSIITVDAMVSARPGASIVNHAVATSATRTIVVGADSASSGTALVHPNPNKKANPTTSVGANSLAFTGLNIAPIAFGGFLLMLVGISFIMGARRRRTAA